MEFDAPASVQQTRDADLAEPEGLGAFVASCLRIAARRAPLESLCIGASRFGGSPDAPIGFEWPTHRGRPLTFLAQLDLSELPKGVLPDVGWLLFFYDVAEQPMGFDMLHSGGARVLYVDVPRSELDRLEHPDVRSAGGPFEPCCLSFTAASSVPDPDDRIFESKKIALDAAQIERYRAVKANLEGSSDVEPHHQLLGHPRLLQGDMRGGCELVNNGIYCGEPSGHRSAHAQELLARAAGEWQLLLQLDSDEAGPEFSWSDSGRIYFWIRRSDLATRAFERTWLILQHSS